MTRRAPAQTRVGVHPRSRKSLPDPGQPPLPALSSRASRSAATLAIAFALTFAAIASPIQEAARKGDVKKSRPCSRSGSKLVSDKDIHGDSKPHPGAFTASLTGVKSPVDILVEAGEELDASNCPRTSTPIPSAPNRLRHRSERHAERLHGSRSGLAIWVSSSDPYQSTVQLLTKGAAVHAQASRGATPLGSQPQPQTRIQVPGNPGAGIPVRPLSFKTAAADRGRTRVDPRSPGNRTPSNRALCSTLLANHQMPNLPKGKHDQPHGALNRDGRQKSPNAAGFFPVLGRRAFHSARKGLGRRSIKRPVRPR
jgi:hypothetical protein